MFVMTRHITNDSPKYVHTSLLRGSDSQIHREIECIRRNMPLRFRLFSHSTMIIEGYCSDVTSEPFDFFKSSEYLKLDELKHMIDGVWVTCKCQEEKIE
jgi:hypothetical protein